MGLNHVVGSSVSSMRRTSAFTISGFARPRVAFIAVFVVSVAIGGGVDVVMNVAATAALANQPGRLLRFHAEAYARQAVERAFSAPGEDARLRLDLLRNTLLRVEGRHDERQLFWRAAVAERLFVTRIIGSSAGGRVADGPCGRRWARWRRIEDTPRRWPG